MERAANWISDNPYWTIIGLALTILGIIIAIVIAFFQTKRKRLHYTTSTHQLVAGGVSTIDNIEILFQGEPIKKLSVTNIYIQNKGNTIITPDDFYNKHELKVITNEDLKILSVDTLKESSDTIESHLTITNNQIIISFQAFEKKDRISFNVYHTGNRKSKLVVDGRLREGKIIDKTSDDDDIIAYPKWIGRLEMFFLRVFLIIVLYNLLTCLLDVIISCIL